MKTINSDQLTIRTEIQSGDLGYLTYLHGKLYGAEYGYNLVYEKYVAQGLAELMEGYDSKKDHIWLIEDEGEIIGAIAIMGRSGKVAQLRYFLLLSQYRGLGLGKKLIQLALDFCVEAGYRAVYLWTATELEAAAYLYQKFGFVKTQEVTTHNWGKEVVEACYDLMLE
ncbi:hypothetical protein BKI52_16625 [marine bacterium AO1-C]|nr:hypothetical protein BKI52_16625 [marine bacterium AO1-C]